MFQVASDPLKQFQINSLIGVKLTDGINIDFTNSALWMVLSVMAVSGLVLWATRTRTAVPNRLQIVVEMLYTTAQNLVKLTIGNEGMRYFPFIFTLFNFILFGNLLGLIPGSFTFTSHLAVNFFIAFMIFIYVTILGIIKHRWGFLRTFFPSGAPIAFAPLIVPIEILSYFSKPVSLSVRLFANMVVGHVLLKIIAGFVITLGIAGIVPWVGLVAVNALELLVAGIQAYVFAILTCIYINDALHLH